MAEDEDELDWGAVEATIASYKQRRNSTSLSALFTPSGSQASSAINHSNNSQNISSSNRSTPLLRGSSFPSQQAAPISPFALTTNSRQPLPAPSPILNSNSNVILSLNSLPESEKEPPSQKQFLSQSSRLLDVSLSFDFDERYEQVEFEAARKELDFEDSMEGLLEKEEILFEDTMAKESHDPSAVSPVNMIGERTVEPQTNVASPTPNLGEGNLKSDIPGGQVKEEGNEKESDEKGDPNPLSRIDLGDKAGLQFADRNKVNQVIYEMSKNSNFYKNEQRKAQKTQEKIDELIAEKEKLSEPDAKLKERVDQYVTHLEAKRDLTQTWVHADMDAFYAAVEIRDNPSLKGKPIAVGNTYMISTSSYEARKFGVRSAMPGFIGKQLCPDLIFVKPNFRKYEQASEITRQIYSIYDPQYEPLSLDEAGLNITEYLRAHPDKTWEDVVVEMRRLIFEQTKLTCSIGIGCNRRLAKMAADVNKPDGYFQIEPNRQAIISYLEPLPVRKLWGVGKVTEQLFNGIGIKTVKELFDNRYLIAQLFSETSFTWFIGSSMGVGGEQHSEEQGRKSVGRQRTFSKESAPLTLMDHLKYVCGLVSKDMVEENNLKAKCVTLVTKSSNFQLKTRAKTIGRYINSPEDIFDVASELLTAAFPIELRLLGVRMTHFDTEAEETAANEGIKPITKFFQKTSKEEFQKQLMSQQPPIQKKNLSVKDEVEILSVTAGPAHGHPSTTQASKLKELFANATSRPPSSEVSKKDKVELQTPISKLKKEENSARKSSMKSFFKLSTSDEFLQKMEEEVNRGKKRERSDVSESDNDKDSELEKGGVIDLTADSPKVIADMRVTKKRKIKEEEKVVVKTTGGHIHALFRQTDKNS